MNISKIKLLLLSNSKNFGTGYLEHAVTEMMEFLGKKIGEVIFIPFANVRNSFDDYTSEVRKRFNAMGYKLVSVHEIRNPHEALNGSESIIVGGGNTFCLLKKLHETGLFEIVRSRISAGVPYIGWSAGANIVCPTIKTTNDMPIIEVINLIGFSTIPFQINPHYTEFQIEKYQGETRSERIAEFTELNPNIYVVGLREGSILRVKGSDIELLGDGGAKIFRKGLQPAEYFSKDSLKFLLD